MIILAVILFLWATAATVLAGRTLLFDRGHRVFGVRDTRAQAVVVELFRRVGLSAQVRFRIGPTDQVLLRDGNTVIHCLDAVARNGDNLTGTGISMAVAEPEKAATEAIAFLNGAGYKAHRALAEESGLPPAFLTVVELDAFFGWVLVFRRPGWRMARLKNIEYLSIPRVKE